jgi:hypothetical protein
MKETASHSNMPVFAENHSCTKPVLYQHPTAEEMRTPRSAFFWADVKDFVLFILMGIVCWLIISAVITALFGG